MKKLFLLPLIVSLVFIFSLSVKAVETLIDEEYYSEAINSIIDAETADKLQDFGLESFTLDEIYSVSFDDIGRYFTTVLQERIKASAGAFFRLLCIVVLGVSIKAFVSADGDNGISILSVIATVFMSSEIINSVLNSLLASMKTGGDFMLAFIPIYTVILSLSGNVSAAITYNSLTFAFAQGISAFINNFAVDLIGLYFALSIAFSMNRSMKLSRFVATVNKISATVLGFFASTFATMLSVRGLLSVAVDSASSKSIKFLLSSLIPIVGSSISDAYASVLGSINVIKGSVAFIGIIVILIITVPPIIESVVYCACFSVLSYLCDIADFSELSDVLKSFSSGVRIVVLMSIFEMFILTVSTGIMLTAKGVV